MYNYSHNIYFSIFCVGFLICFLQLKYFYLIFQVFSYLSIFLHIFCSYLFNLTSFVVFLLWGFFLPIYLFLHIFLFNIFFLSSLLFGRVAKLHNYL